jgi:hypothetical protein
MYTITTSTVRDGTPYPQSSRLKRHAIMTTIKPIRLALLEFAKFCYRLANHSHSIINRESKLLI